MLIDNYRSLQRCDTDTNIDEIKNMVNLLLEETPQGGLSCRYAAIHLQGDRASGG